MKTVPVLLLLASFASAINAQEVTEFLPGVLIRQVCEIAGDTWIASDEGAYRLRDEELEKVVDGRQVYVVAEVEESIWLGTETGLLEIEDGRLERILDSSIGSSGVVAIRPVSDGVLLGTTRGLFLVSRGAAELTRVREPIYRIERVGSEIWICSRRNLYRWASGDLSPVFESPRAVVAIHSIGPEVWARTVSVMGRPGPAFRIRPDGPSEFRPFSDQPFSRLEILSIAELDQETYFGTTRGLWTLQGDGSSASAVVDGPSDPVSAMVPFDGGLVLGTTSGAFWRRSGDKTFESLDLEGSSGAGANVRGISLIHGEVWLATTSGVYRWQPAPMGLRGHLQRSPALFSGVGVALLLLILLGHWLRTGNRSERARDFQDS